MADVGDFTTWSSTASSNSPSGSTVIGAGLDDNLRTIQAEVAKWRDGTGYGILTVTSVGGTANAITGNTSPAPTLAANYKVLLTPGSTNTAATTLALNSGSAKNIYAGNSALVGGELHANIPVLLQYDGTQFQMLGPIFKQPTTQVLTSGTAATYTTPTGCTHIEVECWGPGGGGGAQATNAGSAGSADTTFGSLTAAKGSGGSAGAAAGGAGGSSSGGDVNISGEAGEPGTSNSAATAPIGGKGGSAPFIGIAGRGGANNAAGGAAPTNSGGGGGGGGGSTGPQPSGGGGGGGGYCRKLITAPSSTYTYTIGTGGAAGSAGGAAGGAGGDGLVVVKEFYS